ncbi:transcriptional regulator GcvA [Cocleimonas flava]|uniref:LysR family glycine cleavage system transcriptional activator n=1 Tax=Cocleimonas flava TaxID=634765 RepID=A0A4R1EP47_9GAMM|nr:LysR substrate-binding domain-containing protein [Cocleimonas flava]TCJ83056.1 LysR family glycine cleavage system transcriptional activator [Cocleimonas flava]
MLDKRTMPLSALRAFESTGHRLHMGQAGEDLGVTQGAISHHIRALEKELGVKLFTRSNNRLQLTDSGERLLKAVTEGFDRILDGAQHLDSDSLSGRLVIGCTQTAGANWAAPIISEFHQSYPLIDIHTVEIKPQQKEIPREIDIAICYGKPIEDNRLVEELTSLDIFPVCSPRLVHKKNTVSKPKHLTNFPLLHEGLQNWSRWFSSMNITPPENTKNIHFFNTNLTLSAARDGYGIALCNRLEVQQDLLEGRLIQLLDKTIPELDSYYLLSDKPEKRSLRAKLFEEWIKNIFN